MAAIGLMGFGGGGAGTNAPNESVWQYAERKRAQDLHHGGPGSPRKTVSEKSTLSPRKGFGGFTETDKDKENKKEHGGSGSDIDLGLVVGYAKLIEYDRKVRFRNNLNFFLAVASIVSFMAEIWLAYDESKCWNDWPISGINPATNAEYVEADIDYRLKDCLQHTKKTMLAKFLIAGLTGLQVLLLIDYYRLQLSAERSYWFVSDSITFRDKIWWFFVLELIVILPHPVPLPEAFATVYDDKLGAIMFLRIYLVIRVLRDHSPIYRSRSRLLHDASLKKSGAVEFNWLLAVRFLFAANMWTFVIVGSVLTWFSMSYLVWIFEREHNKAFSLDIAVWMILVTMTTVGYGDITPKYGITRVLTGIAALLGIINLSLLSYVVMENLMLSPQDTRVNNLWQRKQCQDDLNVTAAQYIARSFKFFQDKRGALDPKSRAYKKARKNWNVENAVFKSHLRDLRRTITMTNELDDMVIGRLEEKIPQMTEDISSLLGEMLGLQPTEPGQSNNCLGMLGSLAQRLNGIEAEQKITLEEVEKLIALYEGRGWW